jgi:ribosome-associated protein
LTGGERPQQSPPTTTELADEIAHYAAEKKAREILELDVRGLVSYTDYLLICTGNTERQTNAIREAIDEGLRGMRGIRPRRVEGLPKGAWILMDYLDVVVHIFTPATREFYRLEALWGEAPARQLEESASVREPAAEPATQI